MKETREIIRCNRLLDRELGEHRYAWKWSEDLWRNIQKIDSLGKPEYDYKMNPATGLIELLPVYVKQFSVWEQKDIWVACEWKAPLSPEQHLRTFGVSIEWARNGSWAPISGWELRPGIEPDLGVTEFVIEEVKKVFKSWEHDAILVDSIVAQEKREASTRSMRVDMFKDAQSAFGKIPGSRNSDTSFGGTGFVN